MNRKKIDSCDLRFKSAGKQQNEGGASEYFLRFIKERGASARVLEEFASISITGQIALTDGLIFSEREIFIRNEFVTGEFIYIGARQDYDSFVLNLHSGMVGITQAEDENMSISEEDVESINIDLIHLLANAKSMEKGLLDAYIVPRYFHIDDVRIMKKLSKFGLGHITRSTKAFRSWLHHAGVPEGFCLYQYAPVEEVPVSACSFFSYRLIMKANFPERRQMNPKFMVIGTCPDGTFIVLDFRRKTPSVGYVAIEEVGDEEPWDKYFVNISPTLGSFLHDAVLLQILPDDYYQAKELGY